MKGSLTRKLISVVVVVAVAAALAIAYPHLAALVGRGKAPPMPVSVALAAPVQIPAFPSDKAGMSAYVKIATPVDLQKVASLYLQLVEAGQNYVIGDLTPSGYQMRTLRLYADTSGWLVAYVPPGGATSLGAGWSGSGTNLAYTGATAGLLDLLKKAVESQGQSWATYQSQVKYYHWAYPQAIAIDIFYKIAKGTTAYVSFQVPSSYTVYEQSQNIAGSLYDSSEVQLDGSFVCCGDRVFTASTGAGHTFYLYPYASNGHAGLAVFIVHK